MTAAGELHATRPRTGLNGHIAGAHVTGPCASGVRTARCMAGTRTLRQTVPVDQDVVTSGVAGPVCHCCGKPLPEGNLAWDYPVPDPAAFLSAEELGERAAFRSQKVMSITGLGNFICVVLPVPVEHDREATPGIWLSIPEPREWKRVMEAGRQGGDSWAGLRFAGRVATAARPWPQIFGAWH